MDSFALPVVQSHGLLFPEPSFADRRPGNPFPDHFPDFWTLNINQGSQFSSDAPTTHVDSQFDRNPELLSNGNPEPILGDILNRNTANPQLPSEEFDALLAGGTANVSAQFSLLEEEHPTSPSYDNRANTSSSRPLPAFPGAEGFGALSVGGRGGRIIEVTNLKNAGTGSLRAALEAEGPRIVVFRVGGTIKLYNEIKVTNPYVTVAGQTAPGDGILIRGVDSKLLSITNGVHDVIIRYLRFRNGSGDTNGFGHDNISINSGYNIILDHVSMSWSTDENASLFRHHNNPPIYNVTIQRSSFGEGLQGHSNGLLISGETDFSDPKNPIEAWRGINQISIHHNLFIHNDTRNPRVTSSGTQVINNVIYNWGRKIGETTFGSVVDFINNYAKAGPVSSLDRIFLHENSNPAHPNDPYPDPSIYTEGNIVQPIQTDPNADNWDLWELRFSDAPVPKSYRRSTPLQQAPIPVDVQSADQAYESVLADVGANARLNCLGNWIPNADPVDQRYISDVLNNFGENEPIRRPYYGGGYPDIESGTPCEDSDRDGMPNAWENQHQFNPQDPSDGLTDADGDGYTNVEEYLNGT